MKYDHYYTSQIYEHFNLQFFILIQFNNLIIIINNIISHHLNYILNLRYIIFFMKYALIGYVEDVCGNLSTVNKCNI